MCAFAVPHYPEEPSLPLFRREVRERLSLTALDLLLQRAEIFVEGGTSQVGSAAGTFFGSAMLTLDLDDDRLRRPHDDSALKRLCEALHDDRLARRAVVERAIEVGRARLDMPVELHASTLRCRIENKKLLVDLDLESGPDDKTERRKERL